MWNYKLTLKFRARIKEQFVTYDISAIILLEVPFLSFAKRPFALPFTWCEGVVTERLWLTDDVGRESSSVRSSRSYPQDCEQGITKVSSLFTMRFTLMRIDKCPCHKWLNTRKTLSPFINVCLKLANPLASGTSRKLTKFFRAIFLKREAMFCFYFCVDVARILKLAPYI